MNLLDVTFPSAVINVVLPAAVPVSWLPLVEAPTSALLDAPPATSLAQSSQLCSASMSSSPTTSLPTSTYTGSRVLAVGEVAIVVSTLPFAIAASSARLLTRTKLLPPLAPFEDLVPPPPSDGKFGGFGGGRFTLSSSVDSRATSSLACARRIPIQFPKFCICKVNPETLKPQIPQLSTEHLQISSRRFQLLYVNRLNKETPKSIVEKMFLVNPTPVSDLQPPKPFHQRKPRTPVKRLRKLEAPNGRRSRSETPLLKWKIHEGNDGGDVSGVGDDDPIEKDQKSVVGAGRRSCRRKSQTVSARKVVAGLWRLHLPVMPIYIFSYATVR
ncbi:hypothetical protein PIB30_016194 [Stylosanthes scabra]|uniref:Uncharacterized protein n=1 Tax=Stylosanthes scabra TaxID=79078 RepID=A0ABU6V6N6_9FABA|nr:hypothetical protein [Stylosanthes scabra]